MLSIQRWQSVFFQCLSPNLKSLFPLFFLLKPPIQIIGKSLQLRQHCTHTGPDHFSPYLSSRLLQQPPHLSLLPPLPSYVLFSATVGRVILLRCQVMHFLFTMISWISISLLVYRLGLHFLQCLGLISYRAPLHIHSNSFGFPALLSTPGWVLPQGLHTCYKFWPELFSPSGPRTLTFFRTLPKCYLHSPFSDHPI